ncbi:MAG: hypothetical protein SFX74_10795 [Fimbriimonadaceae bacterium]|nr:hypothetical protein [Fimbriimonadaceae bacterium]
MERKYTLEQVQTIVQHATQTDAHDAFTEAEILRMTDELGIRPDRVKAAIQALDLPSPGVAAEITPAAPVAALPLSLDQAPAENATKLSFRMVWIGWAIFAVVYFSLLAYETAERRQSDLAIAVVTLAAPLVAGLLTGLHPRFPRGAITAMALVTSLASLSLNVSPQIWRHPIDAFGTFLVFALGLYGLFLITDLVTRAGAGALRQRRSHVRS